MSELATAPEQGEEAEREHRSEWLEVCIVAALTVGLMLARWWWRGAMAIRTYAFTDRHLYSLLFYEVLLAAVLVPILRRRGWDPVTIAGRPTPVDMLRGLGVLLGAYASCAFVWICFAAINPHTASAMAADRPFPGPAAGPLAIVLLSLINPVFEELLWLGYFVQRLQPRVGWRAAALVSVALRFAVHTYQGSLAVIGILPIAVVFTWYYIRTRRLWPVVAAHACMDAIGLVARLRHW
ncbi:MAG TPA: type II CAAX endopeptidase family protein [Gemmatimonadaceae bacterium]|nr:type II CAAX endopeptidase family protein [Gemmatimonadaceae bacterium]